LKFCCALAIVAGQDSGSRQRSLGHLDPKSHRGEQVHATLEVLAFDRCRRRNDCDGIARLERGRFDYFSLHAILARNLTRRLTQTLMSYVKNGGV